MVLAPDKTPLYMSVNAVGPAVTRDHRESAAGCARRERGRPVEIEVVTLGSFGEFDYLLFPVIPPPWRARAVREGSDDLSPTTGIGSGALDWWAHAGAD